MSTSRGRARKRPKLSGGCDDALPAPGATTAHTFSNILIGGSQTKVHVGHAYSTSGTLSREKNLEDEAKKCRNALFLTDPAIDRQSLITLKGERAIGTCEWIRENIAYQRWLLGEMPLLWISGGPGKGKTMLSIFLTQELEKTVDEGTQVVYYFCVNSDEKKNNASAILQLLETPERERSSLASAETLWSIFVNVVSDSSLRPTMAILDGLDECDKASQAWLVKKLVSLHTSRDSPCPAAFHLAIISRPLPGLGSCPQVRIDPDNNQQTHKDIHTYVSEKVSQLALPTDLSDDFRQYVAEQLLARAEGTFLWVGFAMLELLKVQTCIEIEETLKLLPPGLPAMYRRMLLQIDSRRRKVCASIFRWVVLSFRPLSVKQLAAAVAIRATEQLSTQQVMEDWISFCGQLLSVVNDQVSLVHQSLKEYLLWEETEEHVAPKDFRICREDGHVELASTCLDHIHRNAEEYALEGDEGDSRVPSDPLYKPHHVLDEYAVTHWPVHARCGSESAVALLTHSSGFFLHGSISQVRWQRAYARAPTVELWELPSDGSMTSIQMSCFFTILPWFASALRKLAGCVADDRDSKLRTSLHYIAMRGHTSVALIPLLIRRGADVEARDQHGRTALFTAVQFRVHLAVQDLLLSGADPNTKDNEGVTPLSNAVLHDYETLAQVLVDAGADIEARDLRGRTALHYAALRGSTAIAQFLLEKQAKVDARDTAGNTALVYAAVMGKEATVKLLLDFGADVHTKSDKGLMSWHAALAARHEAIARLILRHFRDPAAVVKMSNETVGQMYLLTDYILAYKDEC